jgi:hypothetical protein
MLRVPADQGLMLGAFIGTGAVLSLLFWSVLPVSTPHPHECCKPPEVAAAAHYDPQKSLSKDEKSLKDAEVKITALEHQAAEADKEKSKGGKDKAGVKEGSPKIESKASQPAAGKPAGSK